MGEKRKKKATKCKFSMKHNLTLSVCLHFVYLKLKRRRTLFMNFFVFDYVSKERLKIFKS